MTEAEKEKDKFNFLFEKVRSLYEQGKFKKGFKTFVLISLYNGWLNVDDLYLYEQIMDDKKKASERWKGDLFTTQTPKFEFDMPYYDISYIKDIDSVIEYRGYKTFIHTRKDLIIPEITEDRFIDLHRKNRINFWGKFIGNIINNIEKFLFKKYRKSNE